MMTQLSRLKYVFFKRPKYQRIFAYLATAYLSYVITLGLIIPYTIVSFAPEKISQLLGRPVSVGELRLNPFTYQVELTQLTLKEKDNSPFAGIDAIQLEVNFWQSVFNRALVIENVHLQGPYVEIRRTQQQGKESFNFDDILTTLAQNSSPSTAAEPKEPTKPLRIMLGQFTLTAGKFSFDDHITQARVNYPSINIKLNQLDTEYTMETKGQALNTTVAPPEQSEPKTEPATANNTSNIPPLLVNNHYAVQLKDEHDGEISLAGQFQLSPLKVIGDVQIAKLKLAPLWQFIDEQFYVALDNGEISAKTDYQIDLSEDMPLQLHAEGGQVILEKLNIINKEQQVIHLPLLAVEGIDTDLQQHTIHIKQLHSEDLALHALFNEQGIDLQRLLTPKSQIASQTPNPDQSTAPDNESQRQDAASNIAENTDVKPTTQAETEPTWRIQLDGLSLKNYDINITEHKLSTTAQQWRIYPLDLATQAIVSDLKDPIDYEVSLVVNGQGKLASQGQIDATAGAIAAKLQVDKLVLAQFQPYLAPYVNIQLKGGALSTAGQLSADAKGQAIYRGSVELDDLTILDNLRNAPLVKWQKMHINQLDFDQQKNRIDIDHLAFNQPYAKVVIAKDRSTNISNLIVEAPAVQSATTQSSTIRPPNTKTDTKAVKTASGPTAPNDVSVQPELSLNIQQISFSQGSAFFADNSLTPNFASGIEQLEGNIKHLSSTPGTKASVDIKGKIDKYAPVTLKGDINPLLDMPYLDLDLVFKSVELTSVNPYSGTYAGYYIDKGQLSLALNYQLERNQLKGSNHLVIDQLKLGKPSNSDLATSLPITLAIALLQDRNGVIDLGMEVSGDLDSPSFSVGSIIMTALTNVITKVVTAPFSFLAGLVGSDETLDKISFSAGNVTLDSKAQESLDKLASALTDRPMLKLSIEGSVDAINDSQIIVQRMMKRKLAKLANIQFSELPADLSPSQFPTQGPLAEALIKLYEQEVAADPQLIKDTVINDAKDTPLTDDEITTRWHIALYNLCVKAQNVTDGMLGDLAQERAKTVKTYLVESKGIAPERIFLLESRVTLSQNAAQVNMTIDVP
ncbi:DUF748 domain-containing protein [Shewanella sp. CG12_big_fil_rev_8_21_14_0_65_47_15]|uniref:DUF748 domain-containing protein n=1 Tax=Shewanella sp. CG12_big_fil_rev_8_21_14_0_65_47_15 TaxID=1975537 RepID=UPI000CADB15A|nr:DUF748 domain-containing protein [Shewanella sp. CG12_big_fil_rev_8_21_14_0_65_47_15]PIW61166.1 MAG: hypothetical protein COW15_09230 [Shewanella sp. CG12_big_fil_rev_8_21_14_0_65_47_15]